MTAPISHPLRPAADPLERGSDGRTVWRRPPETPRQRARRLTGDALALVIGSSLWAVMLLVFWNTIVA